ncbi:MAG TPA: DUF4097 family beta strand repeat-containing protein [Longimicrobiales bacterium]|nr:DUF4097 family beta strand repeat-containing protein [Longimicrobiales bacterium]
MLPKRTSLALLLVLAFSGQAAAQDWTWRKAVPAGRAIEIKGINGDIEAIAAGGNEVQVIARKSARRSDPDDVRIQVVEHAGGVTICAMYPTPAGERANECLPGARGRSSSKNNDVEVDFEVRVPRGVLFTGRTVNGGVIAEGLTADAKVSTVNGSVRVATTALAQASTVNGSIKVRMGRANWNETLEFETVNGGILLELPDELNAEVSASTVNGSLSSDWPMTVRGKWGPKHMNGKIGSGGRELALQTVNGDIELRRRN